MTRLHFLATTCVLFASAACSVDRQYADPGQGGATGTGGQTTSAGGTGQGGAQPCMDGSECGTGFCVNGVCCDTACTGACEACDLPNLMGTCSSACADGFACGATGCKTSCSMPEDCQPNFECNASQCERIPESDCLDGVDNNGDGLTDCADPTCEPVVECVPAAPAAGELGVHVTDGVCPTDYDTPELFHTGLQPQACTGCACATQCSATVQLYQSTDCSGSVTPINFNGPPDLAQQCKNFATTPFKAGRLTPPQISGCLASGTAAQPDPTWTTDDTFCGAKSSATCASAGDVCVAKRLPAEPLCARVDASASCPAGFTTGTDGIFYSDFIPGSCGACSSCNPATSMSCKALLFTPQALDGANCTGGGSLLDTSCGTLNRPSYTSVTFGFDKTGADNCSSNVTSNPPTATGSTRICCQ